MATNEEQGRALVGALREAARTHKRAWTALVPDPFTIDASHEAAEDAAYLAMASARHRLRDHICESYGLSIEELVSLVAPEMRR